ncbi:MAG: HAMP domain-containing histidine kinase, partial [Chloroflexota bacterium]|nr:HAMP domain-containing histidine kinase [Chloroflexota bacterium]
VTYCAELVERMTQDAARTASRATAEELIEVMAHDMNNYLTPLGGWLSVIRQRAGESSDKRYIVPADAAHKGFTRLRALVDDLLDVRRLQYELLALNLQPVDTVGIVQEVIGALQTSELRVLLQVQAPHNYLIQADPVRLRQVLENLLSNALKYSPASEVVDVCIAREESQGTELYQEYITISVADNGPGIAPEIMPTLFTRYAHGPDSTGLGLGLYLARSIATAHGGSLTAGSSPSGGAMFTLSLPVLPEQANATPAAED